jgi:hypothetical protein
MAEEKVRVTTTEWARWLPVLAIVLIGLVLFFWFLGSTDSGSVPGWVGGRP